MNILDLHIHSYYSNDGEFSPIELLNKCHAANMKYISITDHNSTQGIEEAVKYGEKIGIKVIPGIEIDCSYKDMNLHLLGYNINHNAKEFVLLNETVNKKEFTAVFDMIKNINDLGFSVEYEEVLKKAGNVIPTGEFIAEVLMEKNKNDQKLLPYRDGGNRSDNPYFNFYRDFFAKGQPAHVPISHMSLENAISIVKRSGGVPILAHPGGSIKENIVDNLIQIISFGVKGLEVFTSYHTSEQTEFFLTFAENNNLIFTSGSDFHGKNKPAIHLGESNFHKLPVADIIEKLI
jgi:3',5'-nucleoside bisphosphate phosphatase